MKTKKSTSCKLALAGGEAIEFVGNLDVKTRNKLFQNIDRSKLTNDPKFFKKLKDNIWEFRVRYNGEQIRMFAFWDKSDKQATLVISTHGIVKKVSKVPKSDIEKAEKIRIEYFNQK